MDSDREKRRQIFTALAPKFGRILPATFFRKPEMSGIEHIHPLIEGIYKPAWSRYVLSADELDGLIPNLSTQHELNEWERENIIDAEKWCFGRSLKTENILSDEYIRKLHKSMFNKTWKWAGRYRLTEKNIGVPFYQIQERLKALLDDAQYWLDNKTYSLDELAIRFHHRLVSIHPFPNGNGRHARLMTDLIVVKEKSPRFNWGNKNIVSAGAARVNYINALKKADDGDIRPLIEFAR